MCFYLGSHVGLHVFQALSSAACIRDARPRSMALGPATVPWPASCPQESCRTGPLPCAVPFRSRWVHGVYKTFKTRLMYESLSGSTWSAAFVKHFSRTIASKYMKPYRCMNVRPVPGFLDLKSAPSTALYVLCVLRWRS